MIDYIQGPYFAEPYFDIDFILGWLSIANSWLDDFALKGYLKKDVLDAWRKNIKERVLYDSETWQFWISSSNNIAGIVNKISTSTVDLNSCVWLSMQWGMLIMVFCAHMRCLKMQEVILKWY